MGFLDYLNPDNTGPVARAVEGAEYFAASYGYGYVQNRFRERAAVGPVPLDLLAGGVFKAASIGLNLWSKKAGKLAKAAPYANVLGNAGIAAFGHTLGAGAGAKASGVTRLVLAHHTDLATVKKVLPTATILGEIPKAPVGDFLTPAELERL